MTAQLVPGANAPIAADSVIVEIGCTPDIISGHPVNAVALQLRPNGSVRGIGGIVHHNRIRSADDSISVVTPVSWNPQRFAVDLAAVPPEADRIAFVIATDAPKGVELGKATSIVATVKDRAGAALATFSLDPKGRRESALILCELYRRNGQWKIRAVGQGFVDGLPALALKFAADLPVIGPRPDGAPGAGMTADGLEKRLAALHRTNPEFAQLVRKAEAGVARMVLATDRARVAIALDVSGSTLPLYRSGAMDRLIARVMALGCHFDDDGKIDVFLYGKEARHHGELSVEGLHELVPTLLRTTTFEADTRHAELLSCVRAYYKARPGWGREPVFVAVVTDGDTREPAFVEHQIQEACAEGVFWQFVGIGPMRPTPGLAFGASPRGMRFLTRLDEMTGRLVDNAHFCHVPDPASANDDQLFRSLMEGYPTWLKDARSKGVLRT